MLKAHAVILAVLLFSVPVSAEKLVFSPLPMETPYTVASQWKPLLSYLEKTLGVTLEIDYSSTNDQVIEKFKSGQLDLAYLGPLPYVALKHDFPDAEPVVVFHEKNGEPFYTCSIIAAGDNSLSLEKASGKLFALTQPLSTCGYFATEGMLHQRGNSLKNNRFDYIGPHDEVALSVVRGDFDAGGLKTAIAQKYLHLGLTILAESPPLPGLALIANRQKISEQTLVRLREALLFADRATQLKWGDNVRHGVSAASDHDYDGMRQLPTQMNIPQQGNL